MHLIQRRNDDTQVVRNAALPGGELRTLSGEREWCLYSQHHQFLFPSRWSGEVWHSRRDFALDDCHLVAASPHQLVVVKPSAAGSLLHLSLEDSLIRRLAPEVGEWTAEGETAEYDPQAREALWRLITALQFTYCSNTLERRVAELLRALVVPPRPERRPDASGPWDVLQKRLETEKDVEFDLRSLSETFKTSRFSALRAFKRHFGLPPHHYRLVLRVAHAQAALRAGHSPARAAIDAGFFDQSHLTRHFKRVLGITPAQYARATFPTEQYRTRDQAGVDARPEISWRYLPSLPREEPLRAVATRS